MPHMIFLLLDGETKKGIGVKIGAGRVENGQEEILEDGLEA